MIAIFTLLNPIVKISKEPYCLKISKYLKKSTSWRFEPRLSLGEPVFDLDRFKIPLLYM